MLSSRSLFSGERKPPTGLPLFTRASRSWYSKAQHSPAVFTASPLHRALGKPPREVSPPSGSLCPHSSWQSTHRHQSPQERAPVEPQISSPGPPKVNLCLKISAHCAENEAFGLSLGLIRWCTLEEAAAALGRPLRAVLGQPLGKEKLIGCLGSGTPGLTAFTGSECWTDDICTSPSQA